MIVEMLRILSDRVRYYGEACNLPRLTNQKTRHLIDVTTTWRRQYLLIDQLVDELNESFGLILLILTASGFIRMVNNSFQLITAVSFSYLMRFTSLAYFTVWEIGYLVGIAYVCHRIQKEVFF